MSAANSSNQASLPAVDQVLRWPVIAVLSAAHGRALVTDAIRAELAQRRLENETATHEMLAASISRRTLTTLAPSQRRVFNLTGTVLHTNLGRAPLPTEAIEAMLQVAGGASNLEYDLETGNRGDRDHHIEGWLRRLTGAEAATVVNNNAAAVLLLLNTLALRKEVITSRGELIEIGGAFRLPDIMARAGCKLREVGTTNRTYLHDYADAITHRTGLLFKAHTSNYQIQGFTAAPDTAEIAILAHNNALPFVIDLGSGTLVDLSRFGLPHEPTPLETLVAGADLVTFSGDKLLGGPQAGIIVGRADLIARIKKNPMKRALRCDKLTLAALEAVLRLYANPDQLAQRVPTIRLLARPTSEIEAAAHRLQTAVNSWAQRYGQVTVVAMQSQIGSGSLPVNLLDSFGLCIRPAPTERRSGRAPERIMAALRRLTVPVIGRITDGAVWLDLRCLEQSQEQDFMAVFEAAASS